MAKGLKRSLASAAAAGNIPNRAAAHVDNVSTIPAVAPAGGVGAAAGAYDTAVNRDAMIVTINGNRTAIAALQSEYNGLLAKLRTAGIIAT